jgi:hypothetical protein
MWKEVEQTYKFHLVFWPFFGLPFLSPLWWFRPSIFYSTSYYLSSTSALIKSRQGRKEITPEN